MGNISQMYGGNTVIQTTNVDTVLGISETNRIALSTIVTLGVLVRTIIQSRINKEEAYKLQAIQQSYDSDRMNKQFEQSQKLAADEHRHQEAKLSAEKKIDFLREDNYVSSIYAINKKGEEGVIVVTACKRNESHIVDGWNIKRSKLDGSGVFININDFFDCPTKFETLVRIEKAGYNVKF